MTLTQSLTMVQTSNYTYQPDNLQDVIYFCGAAEVPYGFMCQWYESPFVVGGVTYATAEMWMMVMKARLFGDDISAQKMCQTKSPAEHQALGRKVKGYNRSIWNEHKLRIVTEGNYHKFTKCHSNPQLSKWLLRTDDKELVETSEDDRIWGIGYGAANADDNRENWGQNLLGSALMEVRRRLRDEGY